MRETVGGFGRIRRDQLGSGNVRGFGAGVAADDRRRADGTARLAGRETQRGHWHSWSPRLARNAGVITVRSRARSSTTVGDSFGMGGGSAGGSDTRTATARGRAR